MMKAEWKTKERSAFYLPFSLHHLSLIISPKDNRRPGGGRRSGECAVDGGTDVVSERFGRGGKSLPRPDLGGRSWASAFIRCRPASGGGEALGEGSPERPGTDPRVTGGCLSRTGEAKAAVVPIPPVARPTDGARRRNSRAHKRLRKSARRSARRRFACHTAEHPSPL